MSEGLTDQQVAALLGQTQGGGHPGYSDAQVTAMLEGKSPGLKSEEALQQYQQLQQAGEAEGQKYIEAHRELQPHSTGVFIPGEGTVGTGPLAAIGEAVSNPFDVRAKLSALIRPGDYKENLARERQIHQAIHEEHPILNTIPKMAMEVPLYSTIGSPILGAAVGGGLQSAGQSENVAGEKGTNLRGLLETAGGAGAAAATAWALPKVFGWLRNRYGGKADEAARQAVTYGTQSATDKYNRAFGALGEMAPGEKATILKEAGAVGGFRGQKGVDEGIKSAVKDINDEFMGIINKAEATGTRVPIESAQKNMLDAASYHQSNDYIGKVIGENMDRLQRAADKDGFVSHAKLQDVLAQLRKTSTRINKVPMRDWSEHDQAFEAAYRALRRTQDEGLSAALGENAADVRRYSAVFHDLAPIADKALNRMEGNDKVGLLGALETQKGSTALGHGLILAAAGHPVPATGLVLKGAYNTAKGLLGKPTAALRANLSTSLNLGLQKPAAALARTAAEPTVGGLLSAYYAAPRGMALGGLMPEEEPSPAEPPSGIVLPQTVAKAKKRGR